MTLVRTAFSRFWPRRPVHGTQNAGAGDVTQAPAKRSALSKSGVRKCRVKLVPTPKPLWQRALEQRARGELVATAGEDAIVPTPSGRFEVWRPGDAQPLGTFERQDLAQAVFAGLKRARGAR